MAQEVISVGTTPNDNTGDTLRDAFIKTNSNFTELYTDPVITGSMTVDNLRIDGNTLSSTNTNGDIVLDTNGTGAINLAPGTQGINVSNGGTVTTITRTATGTGYTTAPTVTISEPTTAGGVQATATWGLGIVSAGVASGGTGYSLNDVLTIQGGTFATQATLTVTGVSGGVITSVSASGSSYSVAPTTPVSVTGGTGNGATFTISWGISSSGLTITNAGSGYVEQPTVTFSGGGGSGAAAYATVGSTPVVRSLGTNLSIFTSGGEQVRINDSAATSTAWVSLTGGSSTATILADAASGNVDLRLDSRASGNVRLRTAGGTEQLRVSHTASAVNYVQVTGATTTNRPTISAQGSDTDIGIVLVTKGSGAHSFASDNNTGTTQFRVSRTASAVNYLQATGAAINNAPALSTQGTDTNINLQLSPKGTGGVLIGTSTGNNIDKLQVNGSINASDVKIDGESINASIWSRSFLLMGS